MQQPSSTFKWVPAFERWAARTFATVGPILDAAAVTIYTTVTPDASRVMRYTFVVLDTNAAWSIVQTRYSECRSLYKAVVAWARTHRRELRGHAAYQLAAFCGQMDFPARTLGFDDHYTVYTRKAALTRLVELLFLVQRRLKAADLPAFNDLRVLLRSFFKASDTALVASSTMVESDECAICLGDLGACSVVTLSCGHSFHQHCALQWLQYTNTCAVCRRPCTDGHADEVMAQAVDVNCVNHGRSAVFSAVMGNHLDVIDTLVAAGADLDSGGPHSTAARYQIEGVDAAKKLVAAGATVNFVWLENGPLALAIEKDHQNIVLLLCEVIVARTKQPRLTVVLPPMEND
ncbi:hypothetical protein SPRG_09207 [Saprolegnia parasitica CBS 223.65]|uniref:RING-type domain-containing protein n=1 Tax=Saprolegnia parasitica (strain CBS 223.65) TaxID=695850 RepID=A0A067C3G6_SAPPC|nr:hypothetical protein SPRG_09207 [Saprolegnia parasitica CBS 223.65]KDO25068.1 hypothetical protein SPRG_09207 [Saprolegnia parasitica CBS 223.65]|eukprot:XP_012204142.1 hypothetical protein SPRG_09207 [Saprolegnia parasitica CBS 223.65]